MRWGGGPGEGLPEKHGKSTSQAFPDCANPPGEMLSGAGEGDLEKEGPEVGRGEPIARADSPRGKTMFGAELLFSSRLMALPLVEVAAAECGSALTPPALPAGMSCCCCVNR